MEPMQGSKQHRQRTRKPNEIRNLSHSSAGSSLRPITVRSAVQSREGPLLSMPAPLKLHHKHPPTTRPQQPLLQRHCVRAVKKMDSKFMGLCPQGFESPRCRLLRRKSQTKTSNPKRNSCVKAVLGTWCSGTTSALHAEGPGFNPQCVNFAARARGTQFLFQTVSCDIRAVVYEALTP